MTHDLDRLAADLEFAATSAAGRAKHALEETAKEIVADARERAPRRGVPHYAATITSDITLDGRDLAAEIGPDREKNGQAKLANLFEFGTSDQPPRPHLGPALDAHVPTFEERLAEAIGKIR